MHAGDMPEQQRTGKLICLNFWLCDRPFVDTEEFCFIFSGFFKFLPTNHWLNLKYVLRVEGTGRSNGEKHERTAYFTFTDRMYLNLTYLLSYHKLQSETCKIDAH